LNAERPHAERPNAERLNAERLNDEPPDRQFSCAPGSWLLNS
jgi:hypothetical protein